MLTFDHIAITAETLAEGVERVESALGLSLAGGGRHDVMGTHNRVMNMGDLYLEVIAVDPEGARPPYPRWFDIDRFAGPPRLTNWILRCDDLAAEIAAGPAGLGRPMTFRRGDYHWQMAVPETGILPFDNCFPALIQWLNAAHPVQSLPDVGLRLKRLTAVHPQAAALSAALRLVDDRVRIEAGAEPALHISFATPHGERSLT